MKFNYKQNLLIAVAAFATHSAWAEDVDPKHFEIANIKVESEQIEIIDGVETQCQDCAVTNYDLKDWKLKQEELQENREKFFSQFSEANSDGMDVSIDQIINYGVKLWKLIEDKKPVVSVKPLNANALPKSAGGNWVDLENWSNPQGRIYTITYENLYGMEVVKFKYRILYTANGTHNGLGQYLSSVNVQAQNLDVAWGYDVEASASVANIVNTNTKQDPIAGMEVLVDWKVKTVMKDSRSTMSYFIRGDGSFTSLNGRQ